MQCLSKSNQCDGSRVEIYPAFSYLSNHQGGLSEKFALDVIRSRRRRISGDFLFCRRSSIKRKGETAWQSPERLNLSGEHSQITPHGNFTKVTPLFAYLEQ